MQVLPHGGITYPLDPHSTYAQVHSRWRHAPSAGTDSAVRVQETRTKRMLVTASEIIAMTPPSYYHRPWYQVPGTRYQGTSTENIQIINVL